MLKRIKEKLNKRKYRKKKGFTLVELLAVIVILAIIMVITIPLVLNNIGEAKKKSFETVGKTLMKYIDDNYQNCKLGNKDIAKYDESLFDEGTCNLKEDIQNGRSKDWIYNAGYSEKDIDEIKVSINSEGKIDITVKPSDTGEFKDSEGFTTIVLNYDPSCWNYSGSTINGFKGLDEDGNIKEECNGFIEKDSEGLYHLDIPSKIEGNILTKIGMNAFSETDISFVSIPESIEIMDTYAFRASNIKKIEFIGVSSLKSIGTNAFFGSKLEEIVIPTSVTEIKDLAFYNVSTLTKVEFEENSNLTSIANAVFYGTGITSITIPKSVTTIMEMVFYDCKNLTEVKFEQNSKLESIGANSFYKTNITSVVIPKNVTTIGKDAFFGIKTIKYCGPYTGTNWYNSSTTTIDKSNCGE